MAGINEIRTKIKSIKSTQKITRAMEMVAASKMRKAQMRMRASRPYAGRLRDVIAHLVSGTLEFRHPYMTETNLKRAGFIIISTDRGLCGGLNANLFKSTLKKMKELDEQGIEIDICTIGAKGEQFFNRLGGGIIGSVAHLGDTPGGGDVIGPVKIMLDAYEKNNIQKVFLVYNEFINTMTQSATVEQLLPITKDVIIAREDKKSNDSSLGVTRQKTDRKLWDYIYEPSADCLLPGLLHRYVESLVYQGMVENIACEQAARMIAMKSATDNAGDLIDEFQLLYNKARQAAITKELSEIVSGAQAV